MGKPAQRTSGAVLLILVVEIDQDVAMHTIRRQQNENNEIREQQRHVKGVGVIQTSKGCIEKMLTDVLPNSARRRNGSERCERDRRAAQEESLQSVPRTNLKAPILPEAGVPIYRHEPIRSFN